MKQQKLYEKIEEILANEIAEGLFQPGDTLPPERELMERFDVGRPSIREALFSLSRRGLIEAGSGRRARVLEPSFDIVLRELDLIVRQVLRKTTNIFHLMELRRILECALVRKLAAAVTDAQIEELGALLADNKDAIGQFDRFWQSDSNFHRTIARMGGNPLLPQIVDVILNWLIDNRRVTLSAPGSDVLAYKQHRKVYEAIAKRDPDLAEEAMKQHLLSVEERVAEQIR